MNKTSSCQFAHESPNCSDEEELPDEDNKDGLHDQTNAAAVATEKVAAEPDAGVHELEEHTPEGAESQTASLQTPTETEVLSYALRLPSKVIDDIYKTRTSSGSCVVFKWKHNLRPDTPVCFVEACQAGKVVAKAVLRDITVLSTFKELRGHRAFKNADTFTQQVWRKHIAESSKVLYVWNFYDLCKLKVPLKCDRTRGRSMYLCLDKLERHRATKVGLDLRDTCDFFLHRLSKQHKRQLKELCKKLDKKVVTIGSTCSGTDVCVNVVKATFERLSREFGASWFQCIQETIQGLILRSSYCVVFACIYICVQLYIIYIFYTCNNMLPYSKCSLGKHTS